ncbi:UNVERIFIED_CONTAM: hypothetical protein RKD50_009704 [Streptomyces canus]
MPGHSTAGLLVFATIVATLIAAGVCTLCVAVAAKPASWLLHPDLDLDRT